MHFNLAQARTYRGITQEDFAVSLGVSVPTMVAYEKDTGSMKVSIANKAAKLLDFSFDGTDFIPAEIEEATK